MSTRFTNLELQRALQIILGVVDFERPDGDVASARLNRLCKGGSKSTKSTTERAHWHTCMFDMNDMMYLAT